MESLNMAKLNLSSVRNNLPENNAPKQVPNTKFQPNTVFNPDEVFRCEYRKDIWKTLLEQDAEKPPIHLQSPQLEFRGALVQQLRDVTKKLSLTLATLHTAVAQLDLFMDAHRLRADRLSHVALACLSLTAKSEEKYSRAPSLKTLAKASGVQLCGKTLRQLEWMVGQHVKWRMLAPTPVTFAALLAKYVVGKSDLTTRHPKFVRRFKRDGAKILEAYLDLTLSDVRLKVVESVDVACACVACARAELGLEPWPKWLAKKAGRQREHVSPIARLLLRMMEILKTRETVDSEADPGYGSGTSPNQSPCGSSSATVSPRPSTCCTSAVNCMKVNCSYRRRRGSSDNPFLDLSDTNLSVFSTQDYKDLFRLPPADAVDQRVNSPADYRLCRAKRLIDGSYGSAQPSTSRAVKRGLEENVDIDVKRYRLTTHGSQAVL